MEGVTGGELYLNVVSLLDDAAHTEAAKLEFEKAVGAARAELKQKKEAHAKIRAARGPIRSQPGAPKDDDAA